MVKASTFMAMIFLSGALFSYRPVSGMQLYHENREKLAKKYTELGFQLLQEDDVEGAIENFTLAGFWGNQKAWVIMGEIFEASNNNERALGYYKKAQDTKNFSRLSLLCQQSNAALTKYLH